MATTTETKVKALATQSAEVETKVTAGTGGSPSRFPDLYSTRGRFY